MALALRKGAAQDHPLAGAQFNGVRGNPALLLPVVGAHGGLKSLRIAAKELLPELKEKEMAEEFRLGIVGLGGIAVHAHGPAIKRSWAGIRFSACCGVRPEAVKSWRDAYGGTGYTDYQEMARKSEA